MNVCSCFVTWPNVNAYIMHLTGMCPSQFRRTAALVVYLMLVTSVNTRPAISNDPANYAEPGSIDADGAAASLMRQLIQRSNSSMANISSDDMHLLRTPDGRTVEIISDDARLPREQLEVKAQDYGAMAEGRICFDIAMPVIYFCMFPAPYLSIFPTGVPEEVPVPIRTAIEGFLGFESPPPPPPMYPSPPPPFPPPPPCPPPPPPPSPSPPPPPPLMPTRDMYGNPNDATVNAQVYGNPNPVDAFGFGLSG